MSRWSLVAAWVLVATAATAVTWQIVSAADARVSDRPPIQVAAPLPVAADSSTTTTAPPVATTQSTTSTTIDTSTTVTVSPGSSSTTGEPPTTQAAVSSRTIRTGGGVVVVSYRPGEVTLASASPAAGFAAEVKKGGPPEVDVEFESDSAKYRVEVEWSDGALDVEIDEDD